MVLWYTMHKISALNSLTKNFSFSTLTINRMQQSNHPSKHKEKDRLITNDNCTSPSTHSEKKSLWNFSISKLSPRRSVDCSNFDKFNSKNQSAFDYINLPNQLQNAQLNAVSQPNDNKSLNSSYHQQHSQSPEIISRSQDCAIETGATAVLSCHIRNHESSKITWRKTEPNPTQINPSNKFNFNLANNGEARLIIKDLTVGDSGLYVCAVSNRFGTTQCTIGLTVLSQIECLGESNIEVLSPTSVRLSWDSSTSYIVEYCRFGSMMWIKADENPVKPMVIVQALTPGETYSFRLICANSNVVSLPSPSVVMPASETHLWQQQQFSNRYFSVSELGRGRFSVVRLAKDSVTGHFVAMKQISRRKQDLVVTKEEYKLMAATLHISTVRGLALFENAPCIGVDTIIME